MTLCSQQRSAEQRSVKAVASCVSRSVHRKRQRRAPTLDGFDMSGEAPEVLTEYVRVKRKTVTMFISAEMASDTVHDLRARVNLITKVPTTDIKFFIDELGEVQVDDNKTLKDQKIENDMVLYMILKKEGSDEWEEVEVGKKAEAGES